MSGSSYFDADGKPTPLAKLVRTEPDWAMNVITMQRTKIDQLQELLTQAINQYAIKNNLSAAPDDHWSRGVLEDKA